MLTFNATLALLFSVFLLGMLWPHRNRFAASASFGGYFAKSLWIVWIIVVMTYVFPIGHLLNYGLYMAALILIVRGFVWDRERSFPFIYGDKRNTAYWGVLAFIVGLAALTTTKTFAGYDLIFTQWDAIVSWNRWAIEFANQYYNSRTAYPVYLPGLWSFIYNVQGTTDVWIFAKFFIPLAVIMMVIYGLLVFLERRIAFAICILGSLAFLTYTLGSTIANGYMDGPVTLFILFAYFLLIDAIQHRHEPGFNERLKFSILVLAVTAIIKQPGVLALLPAGIMLLYFYKNYGITGHQLAGYFLLLMIPLTLYLGIFFSQDAEVGLAANLDYLQSLSEERASGDSLLLTAANHFLSAYHLIPVVVTILAGIFNLQIWKEPHGILGLSSMLTFLVGFVVYAQCCSYGARNAYWLMALLLISACCYLAYKAKDWRAGEAPSREVTSHVPPLVARAFWVLGIAGIGAAVIVAPSLVANTLSPDGILEEATIDQINSLRWQSGIAGFAILLIGASLRFWPRWPFNVVASVQQQLRPPLSAVVISRRAMAIAAFTTIVVLPSLAAVTIPSDQVQKLQVQHQRLLGGAERRDLILKHLDKLGQSGLILSSYQPIAYNPSLPNKFALCRIRPDRRDDCTHWRNPGDSSTYRTICRAEDCVTEVASQAPSSLYFIPKWNLNTKYIVNEFSKQPNIDVVKLEELNNFALIWLKPVSDQD